MIIRGGRHPHPASWSRSATGPPVVNARDIIDTPGPSSMSRLPRHQGAPTHVTSHPESPGTGESTGNPLQAILSLIPSSCQSRTTTTPPMYLQTNQPRGLYEGRGNGPVTQTGSLSTRSNVTMTSEKDADDVRRKLDSPQSSPLALTTKPAEQVIKNFNTFLEVLLEKLQN